VGVWSYTLHGASARLQLAFRVAAGACRHAHVIQPAIPDQRRRFAATTRLSSGMARGLAPLVRGALLHRQRAAHRPRDGGSEARGRGVRTSPELGTRAVATDKDRAVRQPDAGWSASWTTARVEAHA